MLWKQFHKASAVALQVAGPTVIEMSTDIVVLLILRYFRTTCKSARAQRMNVRYTASCSVSILSLTTISVYETRSNSNKRRNKMMMMKLGRILGVQAVFGFVLAMMMMMMMVRYGLVVYVSRTPRKLRAQDGKTKSHNFEARECPLTTQFVSRFLNDDWSSQGSGGGVQGLTEEKMHGTPGSNHDFARPMMVVSERRAVKPTLSSSTSTSSSAVDEASFNLRRKESRRMLWVSAHLVSLSLQTFKEPALNNNDLKHFLFLRLPGQL